MPGARSDRRGQTYAAFSNLKRRRFPNRRQRTIALCNVDEKEDDSAESVMNLLCRFVSVYFGMPCREADPFSDSERRKLHARMNGTLPQYQTGPIEKLLKRRLRDDQKDTFAVVGVTLVDLYPNKDWNFVLGEASPMEGVGVFSFVRFTRWFEQAWNAMFEEEQDGTTTTTTEDLKWTDMLRDARALRRALQTLAHEIGHLFHLEHCIYYQCVMNGANSVEEADGAPMHLCPVCLRKLFHVVAKTQREPLDIMGRYQRLASFLEECGLEDDARWYRDAVQRCSAPVAEANEVQPMEIDSPGENIAVAMQQGLCLETMK